MSQPPPNPGSGSPRAGRNAKSYARPISQRGRWKIALIEIARTCRPHSGRGEIGVATSPLSPPSRSAAGSRTPAVAGGEVPLPIAKSGAVDIHYATHGAGGDPAVLVHGSFEDASTWDLVVPGFAQALAVVTYDRRGYGRSASGPRTHPVADDVADLAAVLEAADHFPAHVIGHAYGGAVAVGVARDRPELVRSVVLHEPPFFDLLEADPGTAGDAGRARGQLRRLRETTGPGAAFEIARQVTDGIGAESGAWERMTTVERDRAARYVDRWREESEDPTKSRPDREALRETLVPALVTYGEESPAIERRVAETLAAELPYARVQRLPECGHAPHRTRPDLYVAVVGTFLLERDVPST